MESVIENPYQQINKSSRAKMKNISINFDNLDKKNKETCCNHALYNKLFQNFLIIINILNIGFGSYDIVSYIGHSEYNITFTLLSISIFTGLLSLFFTIYLFRVNLDKLTLIYGILFYSLVLIELIYNSCIIGQFYQGTIFMQYQSLIYMALAILISTLKLFYLFYIVQKKYKLFPIAKEKNENHETPKSRTGKRIVEFIYP